MSTNNYNYLLKYIIIGDSGVGKSNILLRYTQDKFINDHQLTIGVEFGAKTISKDKKYYRIQIWDTAGQETFRSITRSYYKNSVCACLCYDITNRTTFENIGGWVEDCKKQISKETYLILIGNKIDLSIKREVTYEEGKNLAEKYGMHFLETSAKSGKNISEIFEKSVEVIAENIKNGYYNKDIEHCGIKLGLLEMKDNEEDNDNIGKVDNFVLDKNKGLNKKNKNCCKK